MRRQVTAVEKSVDQSADGPDRSVRIDLEVRDDEAVAFQLDPPEQELRGSVAGARRLEPRDPA